MGKRIWVVVAVIWVLGFLIAGNTTAVSGAHVQQTDTESGFSDTRIDLYGNDVSDAVGDYRVDPYGELYEGHAPDTAVLKLGPAGV